MTIRFFYVLGFISVALLLSASFYLQYFLGFNPCPLCVLQRMTFAALGAVFFSGILMAGNGALPRLFVNSLSVVFSSLGIFLAGRQVWLQHFPPGDATECGVSLKYMLQVLPLNEVVSKIFYGTAECTQRNAPILSLDMAEWSLIGFLFFLGLSVYLFFARKGE